MGITACLKVGHKTIMLRKIFDIFDVEIGYELASERRSEHQNSCKVLAFGRKPTTLDIMKILHGIYKNDRKYAKLDGVKRCWRKANILPPSCNDNINNYICSTSVPI